MLELLETLAPKFKQEFNRQVSLNELTKVSLQLSPKAALVLTNRAVYVLRKKLFSLVCVKYGLEEIKKVSYQSGQVILEPLEGKGCPLLLDVSDEKEGVVKHGVAKIRQFLSADMKRIK